jgi:hypothetical protein
MGMPVAVVVPGAVVVLVVMVMVRHRASFA